ncbi:N-acyl-D-aspartate/D-glutamate deacylase [Sphingobium faniae]|nr:N-acyl-D-aspartate/D-glutamate deacylase [Sphingobium faniae]
MDLVIRNGAVFDGLGGEGSIMDIGIRDGVIAQVGGVVPGGKEEIDASGKIVTPGFVDVHTHYDGQVIWDERLQPSSVHGVTTIVTGNCGVGFAPCRPQDHDALVELMAGVEDIPEVVMADGLSWDWETFPEYLDAVAARPHDVDIATYLPHSALRVYVMGQRALDREEATPEDIAEMARLTREAIRAGSIGFATSRNLQHRSSKGVPIPTVRTAEAELQGIADALKEEGTGVLQILTDFDQYRSVDAEFAMLCRVVENSGRPMSFSLQQKHGDPLGYRYLLGLTDKAVADGLPIKAQVAARPSGLLLGHRLSLTPFSTCPAFLEVARLPFEEKIARLRGPEVRTAILREATGPYAEAVRAYGDFDRMFEIGERPDYEPPVEESIAARAAGADRHPMAFAYDLLLENGGEAILFAAAQNYADGTFSASEEMMTRENSVVGLGDGGAHLGLICDASYPTTMIAHWARDRSRGRKLPLGKVIRMMTHDTSVAVGLRDRGVIAPGFKADINVIDYGSIALEKPHIVYDLPAGGRRVLQSADGYVATILNGVVTYRDGEPTGALPGKLVRGFQPQPPSFA